jgi:hypothetical protein
MLGTPSWDGGLLDLKTLERPSSGRPRRKEGNDIATPSSPAMSSPSPPYSHHGRMEVPEIFHVIEVSCKEIAKLFVNVGTMSAHASTMSTLFVLVSSSNLIGL